MKEDNFCTLIKDLIGILISHKLSLFVRIVLAIVITFLVKVHIECVDNVFIDMNKIENFSIDILGITISLYAIFYIFKPEKLSEMSENTKHRPIDEIAAIFTTTIIEAIVNLSIINIWYVITKEWLKYISLFLTFLLFINIIHITFHFFSLRTMYRKNDK